jgi:pyruvate dehydrogenase E1 component alpha subunit
MVNIDKDHALKLMRQMVLIRHFEEKCAELYSLGKIRGFLHLYIGEEAVAVGAFQALRLEDNIISTYREHGHALVRGMPAGSIMAEMFGKANGCSRGRGGSMHLFDRRLRFYGGFAIVGGHLPVALGLALADKMQGNQRITACFFGDGAVAEGEFHESLNLAALWQLPILFLCENNLYAMGTALARHQSQTDIAFKTAAYGIPSNSVDGMDVMAVESETHNAANAVRSTRSPFFLEYRTYRYRAHSMYDPDLYRTKEEIEQWKQKDPIKNFEAKCREVRIFSDSDLQKIVTDVDEEIVKAVQFAEEGPLERVEDLLKDVYTPSVPSPEVTGVAH